MQGYISILFLLYERAGVLFRKGINSLIYKSILNSVNIWNNKGITSPKHFYNSKRKIQHNIELWRNEICPKTKEFLLLRSLMNSSMQKYQQFPIDRSRRGQFFKSLRLQNASTNLYFKKLTVAASLTYAKYFWPEKFSENL